MKRIKFIVLFLAIIFTACEKETTNLNMGGESIFNQATSTFKVVGDTTIQTVTFEDVGWYGFSTYLEAFNPDMGYIFNPIQDELTIVKTISQETGGQALFYLNGELINTIGDIDPIYGYLVHVKESCTIQITGVPTTNHVVPIFNGWQYRGTTWSVPMPVEDVFQLGTDEHDIVKNVPQGNKIYWPFMNIKTFDNVLAGECYLVHFSDNTKSVTNVDVFNNMLYGTMVEYYDINGLQCSYSDAYIVCNQNTAYVLHRQKAKYRNKTE